MLVRLDDPRAVRLLRRDVEQQRAARPRVVRALGRVLRGDGRRQRRPGPDLPVRVRVGGAHRLAPVLEHLDPAVLPPEVGRLLRPQVDDAAHVGRRHLREREVVARREADDPARPLLALGAQQPVLERRVARRRPERREVVGEHEGRVVGRVRLAVRPRVAGAQVAGRVEGRAGLDLRPLLAALPRPVRPAGRHEHPLVAQRVVAAVRLAEQRRHGPSPQPRSTAAPRLGSTSNTRAWSPVRGP